MRQQQYCYFHLRFRESRNLPGTDNYQPPVLEDADSIQLLIADVIRGLLNKTIDPKTGNSLLYAAQLASLNTSRKPKASAASDTPKGGTAEMSLAQLVLDTLDQHDKGLLEHEPCGDGRPRPSDVEGTDD
jgi:hypothetical protein